MLFAINNEHIPKLQTLLINNFPIIQQSKQNRKRWGCELA